MENIISLIEAWSSINSYSHNPEGLRRMLHVTKEAFSHLEPDASEILPFGLSMKKRAEAPVRIFLGGHLDTVFPPDHPFQKTTRLSSEKLQGPGVVDMKGGLVILLHALLAFENTPESKKVGWEIFLNQDEEIGSPHSTPFLQECAKRSAFALLFEPTLSNGAFVNERTGSSNYHLISKGKAAHAGRAHIEGKNAIYPLARLVTELEKLNSDQTLINVGRIKGGKALNIIPDFAEAGLNARSNHDLSSLLAEMAKKEGIAISRTSFRPPKPFDAKTQTLFELLRECGKKLQLEVKWEKSRGVCDGNTFGAAGVPTIDTLGAEGGGLHTDQEFIFIPSIEKKIALTTLLLQEIAKCPI